MLEYRRIYTYVQSLVYDREQIGRHVMRIGQARDKAVRLRSYEATGHSV